MRRTGEEEGKRQIQKLVRLLAGCCKKERENKLSSRKEERERERARGGEEKEKKCGFVMSFTRKRERGGFR